MTKPSLHRLGGAIIFCLDWERCCDFYQKTLELFLVDRNDERGHAAFQLSGSPLTLERVSPEAAAERGLVGRFTGVCFETDDIAATHRALSASANSLVNLKPSSPSEKCFRWAALTTIVPPPCT